MANEVGSTETGRGDLSAFERGRAGTQQAELRRVRGGARRYALVGVGLFLLAWLLGGIGETLGLPAFVPYADISLSLGFVLALFGAVIAGVSLWEIMSLGVVAGIGHFYKGQDHATHVLSGWGLGLEHTPHIVLGLVLIGVATTTAAFFSFYHTRTHDQSVTVQE